MGIEHKVDVPCKNHFLHESHEERIEAFTLIWANVITQRENIEVTCYHESMILQTKIS